MKTVLLLLSLFLVVSCSKFSRNDLAPLAMKGQKSSFLFTDASGDFTLSRESGLSKDKKEHIVKRQLFSRSDKSEVVEKSIAISTVGHIKELILMRPLRSQYTVWFDKKKYFSEMKVDPATRELIINMEGPEDSFNGEKRYSFPKGNGAFCFFSQVIECAGLTGFLQKAISMKAGSMSFVLIWDGTPLIQEQYAGLPDNPFSNAKLEYEGEGEKGEFKFNLETGTQNISFGVDKDGRFKRMFWIVQGVSVVPEKGAKEESNEE